jgi:hypothetical protein
MKCWGKTEMEKTHRLIEIEWPTFGECAPPARASVAEFQARVDAVLAAMDGLGLTHLVVYGDREHFANLAWLTGFDPRFEEALLIIGGQSDPLLVVGNECEGYLPVSPLYAAGKLRSERFQSFSLLNQPRDKSRLLMDIFLGEGIEDGAKVGCVGWKYFADSEYPDGAHAIDLPAYLVDTLRDLAGRDSVTNATAILMHPGTGLRTFCSPAEIAYFEYTNILASEGMRRMIFGMREGMTDYELAQLAGYNGVPLGCHMTLATGDLPGLSGPVGATLRRGTPLSTNLCYWGSNICRSGWIASSASDLPDEARDYVDSFAGPYFEAMGEWFNLLRIGTRGGELARLIAEKLPFEKFGIFLNPGHLIHHDEWLRGPAALGHGDAGGRDPVVEGLRLDPDGGRRRDRGRDPAPSDPGAVPRLLRPLRQTPGVHGEDAGNRVAAGDPAAVQHPGDRAPVLPEPEHDPLDGAVEEWSRTSASSITDSSRTGSAVGLRFTTLKCCRWFSIAGRWRPRLGQA